jgi:hypothetical protein
VIVRPRPVLPRSRSAARDTEGDVEYPYAVMEPQSDFFVHAQQVHELRSHSLSESDTRVYLIDPVLRMLGYGNFSDLRREVPIPASKEFIDYELLIDGQPKAIVEAKALRHGITDQDAAQCVQYASILGAPWCLITNGAVWHLYYAYGTGALAEKKVAQVRLDGDEASLAEAWRVLSLVSKASLGQANPLTRLLVERVVIDELRRPDTAVVAALRKAVRDRFREQVPSQVILEVLDRLRGGQPASAVAHSSALSLPIRTAPPMPRVPGAPRTSTPLDALVTAGLIPADSSLECTLYGVTHAARLGEGRMELNGQLYDSPSAAVSALRDGKASNGGVTWKYKGQTLADWRARLPQVAGTKLGPT